MTGPGGTSGSQSCDAVSALFFLSEFSISPQRHRQYSLPNLALSGNRSASRIVRRLTRTRRNAQMLAKITSGYVCLPDAGKATSPLNDAASLNSSRFNILSRRPEPNQKDRLAAVSPKSDQMF